MGFFEFRKHHKREMHKLQYNLIYVAFIMIGRVVHQRLLLNQKNDRQSIWWRLDCVFVRGIWEWKRRVLPLPRPTHIVNIDRFTRTTMHPTGVQGMSRGRTECCSSFRLFRFSTVDLCLALCIWMGKKWFSFFVIRNLFTPTRFLFRIITYLTRVHHAYNPTFIIKLISNLFHTFLLSIPSINMRNMHSIWDIVSEIWK